MDQIRPGDLSDVILVQTVCKSYQQTTVAGKELAWCGLYTVITSGTLVNHFSALITTQADTRVILFKLSVQIDRI